MSESYDSFADIGEPHRMAPEGIITEDNIEQLTELNKQNQMEAPIKDKVSRKKNRSEKQKATFEKARQKRLENIANKKSQIKEKESEQGHIAEEERAGPAEEDKEEEQIPSGLAMNENSSPDKTLTKEEIHYDRGPGIDAETILGAEHPKGKKTNSKAYKPSINKKTDESVAKRKKQRVVYIDPSSSEESSSEEEIIYVQRKKSKSYINKRSDSRAIQGEPKKRVVYQDDYGEEAEFQQRPRRNKPISFSDVFKYS